MKKKNVLALGIVLLAAISGYGGSKLYLTKSGVVSDLMVQNVEALSDADTPRTYKCYLNSG